MRLESDESNPFPGDGQTSPEKEELVKLRRENKRPKMEREILKKAAAFFAEESIQGATSSGGKRRPVP